MFARLGDGVRAVIFLNLYGLGGVLFTSGALLIVGWSGYAERSTRPGYRVECEPANPATYCPLGVSLLFYGLVFPGVLCVVFWWVVSGAVTGSVTLSPQYVTR